MQALPQYQTTNDAQAKYYWGSAPFQSGSTFNAQTQLNNPLAGTQGWGRQTMPTGSLSPEEMAALIGSSPYAQQFGPSFMTQPRVAPNPAMQPAPMPVAQPIGGKNAAGMSPAIIDNYFANLLSNNRGGF